MRCWLGFHLPSFEVKKLSDRPRCLRCGKVGKPTYDGMYAGMDWRYAD